MFRTLMQLRILYETYGTLVITKNGYTGTERYVDFTQQTSYPDSFLQGE